MKSFDLSALYLHYIIDIVVYLIFSNEAHSKSTHVCNEYNHPQDSHCHHNQRSLSVNIDLKAVNEEFYRKTG